MLIRFGVRRTNLLIYRQTRRPDRFWRQPHRRYETVAGLYASAAAQVPVPSIMKLRRMPFVASCRGNAGRRCDAGEGRHAFRRLRHGTAPRSESRRAAGEHPDSGPERFLRTLLGNRTGRPDSDSRQRGGRTDSKPPEHRAANEGVL